MVFVAVLIILFVIFVCEDSKELLCGLHGAIFQFYVQKSTEDAEDADMSDLCGPAPPYPVRSPVCMQWSCRCCGLNLSLV